jgi:5-(carboxyamino)imidazole ribonucleotide synthase
MGHINVSGENELALAQNLKNLAEILCPQAFPDLSDFAQKYHDKHN